MTIFIPLCPKAKALMAEWAEEALLSGRGKKPNIGVGAQVEWEGCHIEEGVYVCL